MPGSELSLPSRRRVKNLGNSLGGLVLVQSGKQISSRLHQLLLQVPLETRSFMVLISASALLPFLRLHNTLSIHPYSVLSLPLLFPL